MTFKFKTAEKCNSRYSQSSVFASTVKAGPYFLRSCDSSAQNSKTVCTSTMLYFQSELQGFWRVFEAILLPYLRL